MTDQSLLLDIGGIWAVILEIVETLRVFDRCFERVFFRAIVSIIIHIVIAVVSIFRRLGSSSVVQKFVLNCVFKILTKTVDNLRLQ